MRPIEKTIEINEPKEKVWDVLVKDELNRQWFSEFAEGTRAITDWKQGSKVVFKDDSDNGIFGRVVENKHAESLVIEYDGEWKNGREDHESEMAKGLKGSREAYKLSSKNGLTVLETSAEMHESFYEMMVKAWYRAAIKLKELAERK